MVLSGKGNKLNGRFDHDRNEKVSELHVPFQCCPFTILIISKQFILFELSQLHVQRTLSMQFYLHCYVSLSYLGQAKQDVNPTDHADRRSNIQAAA